jgi:hypothetical protein
VRLFFGVILDSTSSRFADAAAVTGSFAASFGMLAALAFGFFWLMQPTVAKNPGLAAYQPPPKTVVSSVPWTPPPPSTDREIMAASGVRDAAQNTPVLPPKGEVATAQARAAAPRQQRRVYTAPAPRWGYAAPRPFFGFRPWF